jgi:hypothetical protein
MPWMPSVFWRFWYLPGVLAIAYGARQEIRK